MLLEREHFKQKGMPIFRCPATLGTLPALASHSLICHGIARLPLSPKSVLPRLCLQLSCCQPVSDEKCECTRVCCQAENSSDGAFPKTNPGYDDAIDCSLHFSSNSLIFLNHNKKYEANTPSLLSCRKRQVPFYSILCFTLSFLCRVCALCFIVLLRSLQGKDQNSLSALIFTGLTSVWIIALLSAPLLLICISLREIRAWPSVFKAS